jgi:hypothetical protein
MQIIKRTLAAAALVVAADHDRRRAGEGPDFSGSGR